MIEIGEDVRVLVQRVADRLKARGEQMVTAESCTGGLIAGCVTNVPGSSSTFERGFVTYSNDAKTQMLGVPADLIERHGAVSEPVALAMAEGALRAVGARDNGEPCAHWAVAATGIAGPDGGTPDKPVGTVWIAWAQCGQAAQAECGHFDGDRAAVRAQTVVRALQGLLERIDRDGR